VRNPAVKAYKVLGVTQADWQAIKTALQNYFAANEDKEELSDATLRALHPALARDEVWNQVRAELGV